MKTTARLHGTLPIEQLTETLIKIRVRARAHTHAYAHTHQQVACWDAGKAGVLLAYSFEAQSFSVILHGVFLELTLDGCLVCPSHGLHALWIPIAHSAVMPACPSLTQSGSDFRKRARHRQVQLSAVIQTLADACLRPSGCRKTWPRIVDPAMQ